MRIYLKRIFYFIKKRYLNNAGFTLLEMIVAVALSSLILILVYSVHRSITTSITNLTGVADFYENVNLAVNRIDRDISCAYFAKENKNICFISESNYEQPYKGKLNFVTVDHKDFSMLYNMHASYPVSDVKEVGYFLEPDPKFSELFFLVKREENHYDDDPEEGGHKNILLENVLDIKFEFKQGNDWAKKWDSRENNRIPEAVKTTLQVRNYNGADEEFVFISRISVKR